MARMLSIETSGLQSPGQCEVESVFPRSFGNFELLEEIARGGMGVVYRARQAKLNREVAVKMILSGAFASREFIQRFHAEARLVAALQHPNIVAIHDFGEQDGQHFFSMDYVAGRNLGDMVRDGPLPARKAAQYVRTIAEAIHYAHERGILHRDLKPANILVDGNDEPRVTDFGLAKELDVDSELTLTGHVLGSPSFVPPEQAAGRRNEIGPASDVYSLGAILYHLLTGRPPFAAATLETTLSMVLNADVVLPRLLNPSVPRDLETLCLKCLEKEPRKRFQTAEQLAGELGRFLNDEPIQSRPVTQAERLWRWCKRRPAVASLAAGIVLVFLAGFAGVVWQWQRAQEYAANETAERIRSQNAVTRLEVERAELLFTTDRASDALAYLARVLRREPANRVAAERIMAALSDRSFCVPIAPPFEHEAAITSAEFSSDGTLAVTASHDGTARVWDIRDGTLLRTLQHGAEVLSARFSKDGKRIVTASGDTAARVWNAETGQAVAGPLQHETGLTYAEFSPNGQLIVTVTTNGLFRVWNAETGTPQTEVFGTRKNSPGTFRAHFSPDGNWVATLAGTTVRIWNAHTGEPRTQGFNESGISFAEFSPDGRHVAVGGASWSLRYLDSESGTIVRGASDSMYLSCGQFSLDGTHFAMGTRNGTIRILDGKSAEPLRLLKQGDNISSVEFSADGDWLLSASHDNTARIWNVATGEPVSEPLQHDSPVIIARFSADVQRILTVAEGNCAWLREVRSGPTVPFEFRSNVRIYGAWFSRDGKRLLTTPQNLGNPRVWDVRTGELLKEFVGSTRHVWDAQFSPDGSTIASTGLEGKARIWETETGKLLWTLEHSGTVRSPDFSFDGRSVATASTDKTAAIWDVLTGQRLQTFIHDDAVSSVRFSPDAARVVTASIDRTARIWSVTTGEIIAPPLKHGDEVTWAEFNPAGTVVATASRDKTARMWNGSTGDAIAAPMKHEQAVDGLSFSTNGRRLVTRSGNSARVWNAATGEPISESLKHEGGITSARFSYDNLRVVTSSEDMTVRIWDAETGHPISEPLRHAHVVSHAEFSPDDHWIATASFNARIWQVPVATAPIPTWLADLAEGIAGKRFNQRNEVEPVPLTELHRIRQLVSQLATTNDHAQWGHWFFAPVDSRSVSSRSATVSTNSPSLLRARASLLMGRGQWRSALNCLTKSIDLDSTDIWNWDWFYIPMLHLKLGDLAGYRRHCHRTLDRFGSVTNAVIARRIALSCLTKPIDAADQEALAKLIERSLAQGHDYREFAKGLYEHRQGRFTNAVEWLQKALTRPEFHGRDAQAWVILAMAQHQLKNVDDARAALAKAKAVAEKVPKPDAGEFDDKGWYRTDYAKNWYNWLITEAIQIFLEEAENLNDGQPPAGESQR